MEDYHFRYLPSVLESFKKTYVARKALSLSAIHLTAARTSIVLKYSRWKIRLNLHTGDLMKPSFQCGGISFKKSSVSTGVH